MFDDRRKYMRFDIPLDVEYATSSDKSNYRKCSTNNFSREGLGIVSNDYDFSGDSGLELKVKHPTNGEYISVINNYGDMIHVRLNYDGKDQFIIFDFDKRKKYTKSYSKVERIGMKEITKEGIVFNDGIEFFEDYFETEDFNMNIEE